MSPWPKDHSGVNRQIGETQAELLDRAASSGNGQLMIDPRAQNAAWCAMKRMVRRGLFDRLEFGADGGIFGRRTVIYQITDAGRRKLGEINQQEHMTRGTR